MIDPVTPAVIRGRLEQIVDEMDATPCRSAFSPATPVFSAPASSD